MDCKQCAQVFCVILVISLVSFIAEGNGEDVGPVVPPSRCEVCKFLVTELKERLDETSKTKEVLELGHGIDPKKKKRIQYNTSTLRLIEAVENPHICDKIIEYNIHKEREGSNRFAKGQSETFKTLHGLVDKGVNVDLGIPYELWDTPSAEVTQLQRDCYTMVETYEDQIDEWYYDKQEEDIMDFLCRKHILKTKEQKCLDEVFIPKDKQLEDDDIKKANKKKSKTKEGKQKGEEAEKDEL